MSTSRPRAVVLIPQARRAEVLTSTALARLADLAEVVCPDGATDAIAARLPDLLAQADILLTGWGSPPLTPAHLERAPRLRLIAHTAGSIRHLLPPEVFSRGITVCHAAAVIADAVAEMTLLLMLLGCRRVHDLDRALKAGRPWAEVRMGQTPHLLAGRAIGLVGCGYVGRTVVRLLQPFAPTIRVFDPYLAPEQATALGVVLAPLDEVLAQSDIVSLHAAATPETRHLIGARELRLLRDGALFINTARAWLVDQTALLAELRTGRIWAALDVFEPEPLPLDSPFRSLPNVLLTPHVAGHTLETHRRQGEAMVAEIARFLAGEPLQYRIAPEQYVTMA